MEIKMEALCLSHVFPGIKKENDRICTLTATVTNGLESISQRECEEKLRVKCLKAKGRVFFELPIDRIDEVVHLRSVDSVSVLLGDSLSASCMAIDKKARHSADMRSLLGEKLVNLAGEADWSKGMDLWQRTNIKNRTNSGLYRSGNLLNESNCPKNERTCFRIKCDCVRGYFAPESAETVAQMFGEAICHQLHWEPNSDPNSLEVGLHIHDRYMYIDVLLINRLPLQSVSSLRPSVAFCLLKLAGLADGEAVCNLTTDVNSVQNEVHHSWPNAKIFSGIVENSKQDEQTWLPSAANNVFRWDGLKLPLQDDSMDVILAQAPLNSSFTDSEESLSRPCPPFENLLSELARIAKRRIGRAVIMTHRRNTMALTLRKTSNIWNCLSPARIFMPAQILSPGNIFCLARTIGRH